MRVICLDFETFYADDYTLSKMQTDEYILDPRFEVIGVAIDNEWYTQPEVEGALRGIDWSDTAVLCHHAAFDGFILTQRYGIKPALWLDTLGMGRVLYPWLRSHSLASMATELGVGTKGGYVMQAKNMRYADFSPIQLSSYGAYCLQDVALTRGMFNIMKPRLPRMEFALIDIGIRMFTEPVFALNQPLLEQYYEDVVKAKQDILQTCGVDQAQLNSNPKLATILTALGVHLPMKVSKVTGKVAYAFAKSDKEFTALLEHDDERVQSIVAARLGTKSTLSESRAEKFVATAKRGIGLPIMLNHWGAKTTGRASGGNGMNPQNLPARGKDTVLRDSMMAPPGYKVVVGDSANIELRVNMALSGEVDVLEKIRLYDAQGNVAISDLYCDFASVFYGRTIGKKDKAERTLGKVAMLSLGYGAGADTFREMVRLQAGVVISEQESKDVVETYRCTYRKVPALWNHCGTNVLQWVHSGTTMQSVDVNGLVLTTSDGFAIPGCAGIVYKDLNYAGGAWLYERGGAKAKIYSGKVAENLCQHVARHIVMWQTIIVSRKYKVALSVHDEIVCVVKEEEAEECAAFMLQALRTVPPFAVGIPLNGEVGIGDTYGGAK